MARSNQDDSDDKALRGRPRVAIIGDGPGGVIALNAFSLSRAHYAGATFVLFGAQTEPGSGIAHETVCGAFSVNMRPELHDIEGRMPFLEFCSRSGWDTTRVPPRWLLGRYLNVVFDFARAGLEIGANVRIVRAVASSIEKTSLGFRVITQRGESVEADFVILATGNNIPSLAPSAVDGELQPGSVRYYDGSAKFAEGLNAGRRFAVLGCGPGGIDVARYLIENLAPAYPVFMLSRQGRLSKVQTIDPPTRSFDRFVAGAVSELEERSPVTLDEVFATVAPLFRRADNAISLAALIERPVDVLAALEHDIEDARENGPAYRDVLESIGSYAPRIWRCLRTEDQQAFLNCYMRLYYIFRHAMPISTAEWVAEAIQSNKLRVDRVFGPIRADSGELHAALKAEGRVHSVPFDHLIVATGPEWDVSASSSKLIQQLLADGIAERDSRGGFSTRGFELSVTPNVFAMGSLVRAEDFAIHSLPALARHAREIEATIRGRAFVIRPGEIPG